MRLQNQFSLRVRIFLILAGLVLIILTGGLVMIWYTYRMEAIFKGVVEVEVTALGQVEELEIELARQKGFVSYYFIDGNPDWLTQLNRHREEFRERLKKVNEFIQLGNEKEILGKIESEYYQYVQSKDKVIAFYKAGEREKGATLHEQVRTNFSRILDLVKNLRNLYKQKIRNGLDKSRIRARQHRIIAGTTMTVAVALGALLAFIFVTQILEPIRKLARRAASDETLEKPGDEVAELGKRVHGLIEDRNLTRTQLERSREQLLQSEKMAVMGKLAADMAHTIRNPMTSIKMRLFSLERYMELSPLQKEDFEVVAEEMRRLDNIVRNFLEFSRPPRLKMQKINISEVLDMSLQLLEHQLDKHDVEVERKRRGSIPEIEADPELLKEVLVNLMVNALEAMDEGGLLTISEEEAVAEEIGRAVLIRISDTGPGIPDSIQKEALEPFFSTKENGTGLGLSIAKRIIHEHSGRLELRSEEGTGTTFTISLPVREDEA